MQIKLSDDNCDYSRVFAYIMFRNRRTIEIFRREWWYAKHEFHNFASIAKNGIPKIISEIARTKLRPATIEFPLAYNYIRYLISLALHETHTHTGISVVRNEARGWITIDDAEQKLSSKKLIDWKLIESLRVMGRTWSI